MDHEHDPDSVTPPTEEETGQRLDDLQPYERVKQAAQNLADVVASLPKQVPLTMPPFRLPQLRLTYDEAPVPADPPDPRHVIVSVRTTPVRGGGPEWHDYSNAGGLVWQTYGNDPHDFTTERMLEVQNEQGEVVASYPAGTWLDVCYPAYRQPGHLKDMS